jgi:PPM family protein phosphatase
MAVIESSGITDVGRRRKGNEDSLLLDDGIQLYVVADGMGGHKAGEVASRLIIETLGDYIKQFHTKGKIEQPAKENNALSDHANRLMSGIHLSNKVVHQIAGTNPAYQGMGSTVSALYFTDSTMITANVGDSPVYLIRNGTIKLHSVLHTFMAEQEAIAGAGAKRLSEKYSHMLTRAMGTQESVKPDINEIPFLEGDILVISSDGLTDMVSDKEILALMTKTRFEKTCKALVNLANKRGGHDNITVIVLKIKKIPQKEAPPKISAAKTVSIPVDIDTDDDSYRGQVSSISPEHAFIETIESFQVGEEVHLSITIGETRATLSVSGSVDQRSAKGIHVTFEPLSQSQMELIKYLL